MYKDVVNEKKITAENVSHDKMRKLEEIWTNEKGMEKREKALAEPLLTEGNENKEIYRVVQKPFDTRCLKTEKSRQEILAPPCIYFL